MDDARQVTLAAVVRIMQLGKHPNADRLEILAWAADDGPSRPRETLVVGMHYREGDLGVYIPAGAIIPGYLAHQEMWLKGRGGATWFPVVAKNMRGIISPGIFSGQYFRDDREKPEFCAACGGSGKIIRPGHDYTCPICKAQNPDGWTKWRYWCDWWEPGDDVAGYLGIREAFPGEIPT